MTTARESLKDFQTRLSYAHGCVFAAALLCVGMFFITTHVGWIIAGIPLVYVLGILSGGVIGGKLLLRNTAEDKDERPSDRD